VKKILGLFVCLFLIGCLPQEQDSHSRVVSVQIADQKFEIPKEYFVKRLPIPNKQSKVDSISLVMMWPDFGPTPKTEQRLWGEGQVAGFFRVGIGDATNHIPVDEMLWKAQYSYEGSPNAADHFEGEFYDLEKWVAKPPHEIDNDVFIYRGDKWPKGVLKCALKKTKTLRNPSCRGRFRVGNTSIRISFRKENLENWETIRQKLFARIEAFKVNEYSEIREG